MPFDTVLAVAFIVITLGVLALRTHVGLSILLLLASSLILSEFGGAIQSFLVDTFEVFDSLAAELVVGAVILFLPALIALTKLSKTATGRFFHQLFPAIAFTLLSLTLLSSLVAGVDEFFYVQNSYLVNWLTIFQSWIIAGSFVFAFFDVLSQYKRVEDSRRFLNRFRR